MLRCELSCVLRTSVLTEGGEESAEGAESLPGSAGERRSAGPGGGGQPHGQVPGEDDNAALTL